MVRVVSKSFSRPDNDTQALYDVDLELSPMSVPVCSFVPPGSVSSSPDIYGTTIGPLGNWQMGPDPQTIVANFAGAGAPGLYGTANVTGTWGTYSGVFGATTIDATWTWDLQPLGDIPYICTIAWVAGGQFEVDTTRFEVSNDGVTWDVITAYGALARATPLAMWPIQRRYWRLHHHLDHPGNYYQGTEYWAFALWSAT